MLGELSEIQIETLLRSETVGRIGCHADGVTYVVPVSYAYEDGCAYCHTSATGQKARMMRANPAVCFEVDHVENLANWQSVVAQATFEELAGDEADRALQLLLDRFRPLIASATGAGPGHGLDPTEAHRADTAGIATMVFRLRLGARTGRFEKR